MSKLYTIAISTFVLYSTIIFCPTCHADSNGWKKKLSEWVEIEPDLEVKGEPFEFGGWLKNRWYNLNWLSNSLVPPGLYLIRTKLNLFKLKIVTKEQELLTAQGTLRESGSVLAINANFFDSMNKPLGLVVSHGIIKSPVHSGGSTLTGIFSVTDKGVTFKHRHNIDLTGVKEAFQSGPRLIVDGKRTAVSLRSDRSIRAGVCVDDKDRLIFAISSQWSIGLTLAEFQKALLRANCQNALNLDGGGSAQIAFNPYNRSYKLSLIGHDRVPVILTLQRK